MMIIMSKRKTGAINESIKALTFFVLIHRFRWCGGVLTDLSDFSGSLLDEEHENMK
jgi:hypothetical protein